jgi:hypothetical protein
MNQSRNWWARQGSNLSDPIDSVEGDSDRRRDGRVKVGEQAGADSDLALYLSHNYGTCIRPICHCRATHVWHGTSCLHWAPTKAKTWEELVEEMRGRA